VKPRRRQITDHIDWNRLAWQELSDPRCAGDAVVDHECAVGSAEDNESRHSYGRCSMPGDLPVQLHRIGAADTRGRQMQRSWIDIKPFRGHAMEYTTASVGLSKQ